MSGKVKAQIRDLLEYSCFTNSAVATICLENEALITERIQKLFCHILNAQVIWNARLKGQNPTVSAWDLHPLSMWKKIGAKALEESLEILDNYPLEHSLEYTNSKGITYRNTLQEVFFHVANHCTHHRAQICSDLKALGIQPPVTDYIAYKR